MQRFVGRGYVNQNFTQGKVCCFFGFNGQEKDDEITGNSGTDYTAEFWEYDARLGRRWNTDPVVYPWQSSYSTFNNNPIWYFDSKGLYGSKKEARQERRAAEHSGIECGKLYKFGKEWGFNQITNDRGQMAVGGKEADVIATFHRTEWLDSPTSYSWSSSDKEKLINYVKEATNTNPGLLTKEEAEKQIWQLYYAKSWAITQRYAAGESIATIGEAPLQPDYTFDLGLGFGLNSLFAKNVAVDISTATFSQATYGAFEKQLTEQGVKSLLKSQASIEMNLAEHLAKLKALQATGGHTSSIEREIRTFQSQLNAIEYLLK